MSDAANLGHGLVAAATEVHGTPESAPGPSARAQQKAPEALMSETEFLKRGGLWDEDSLSKSIQFTGEAPGPDALKGQEKVYQPKTHHEQESEELSRVGLDEEALQSLTRRVAKYLQRTSLQDLQKIDQSHAHELSQLRKECQSRDDAKDKIIKGLTNKVSALESSVRQHHELIASMDSKIEAMQKSIGEREIGLEAIILDLRSQMTVIAKMRRAHDEPTDASGSVVDTEDFVEQLERATTQAAQSIANLAKPMRTIPVLTANDAEKRRRRLQKMI